MTRDHTIELLRQTLAQATLISAPVLVTTLLVGLLVSLLQAVTQLQDMALGFVPKLLAAALVLLIAGPWMLQRLSVFATRLFVGIAHLG